MHTIRLVIIDDDALVRAGLGMLLGGGRSGFEIVGEGADGSDAVPLVEAHRPDIVLMDIRMPRVDGVAATRQVLALPDPPKVIVLTTFSSDDLVVEALRAGAHGFLLKDTAPPEMVEAIRRAADGERALSPQVVSAVIAAATSHPGDERIRRARAELDGLSERELEVAVELGRGLSNAEIAGKLYQSVATVKATVTRILAKLGCTNRTQVALLVHDADLVD
ncbi:response regulator [Tessaracoccus oleiagri]|uniref:DNA-binding response regulator, NarL/FixJ family, contains REC and HTH domains n=1 Tax=Tessaracoccus oleiagri TaxID=686624 RepID=A0A1G9HQD7_9ACTN|nr:response regulator transcription factor [Tessaracoccus oleiagri]SDL15129.1 DNA-binding response regulator, NarL/FixJ family, contains REC and HTH domains [Tessaracoccus oleiagri]